ncbi:hypothetical protein PoB_001461800 [Plakobranchus ocellatus]|uniref:Ig-like domain-containing protein n=1 Tax=Plakobranchus ocellatus TaxID=259542 RepID=A0AAV3Z025_9GAST|nr:hypothetical protein PoB_001461800 [Plakobranchus ocellatus]
MGGRRDLCFVLFSLVQILAGITRAEEDFQQWSVQTYVDEKYTFFCNDTLSPVFINPDDKLTWRRHGHDSHIVNDDHFELSTVTGVPNMGLTIKKITEEMEGIYFCEIHSVSGDFVARVVKGMNIGGHKYHDGIDKYRRKIITGVISGAAVMVLVMGVCAVNHFRFQTEEERHEKRMAKEERVQRRRELQNGGHDNLGMDMMSSDNGGAKDGLERRDDFTNGVQNESLFNRAVSRILVKSQRAYTKF